MLVRFSLVLVPCAPMLACHRGSGPHGRALGEPTTLVVASHDADLGWTAFKPPRQLALLFTSTAHMDPPGQLLVHDVYDQVAWYKAQGLVDQSVDARSILDLGFVDGQGAAPAVRAVIRQ